MAFPVSPTDGQTAVVNNITYQFSNVGNTWTRLVSTANVITANIISANTLNINNSWTAPSVSVTGNVTGNYFLGNGAFLTGVITSVSNIVSGTSNVNIVSSGGNVTVGVGGTGNVAVFATTGEYVTGVMSASGNVTGGNLLTAGSISATGTLSVTGNATLSGVTTGNISSGNIISGGIVSAAGNVTGGNVTTAGLISATGNISGSYIIGNGSQLTGLPAGYANSNVVAYGEAGWAGNIIPSSNATYSLGNVTNQWKSLYLSNSTLYIANVAVNIGAGNVLQVAGANVVTSTANGTVSTSGNVAAGNLTTAGQVSATGNISGNYFVGNGRYLSGITSGGGAVYFQDTAPTSPNSGDVWIVGNTAVQLIYFSDGDSSQWAEMEAFETYGGANVTNVPGGSIYQIQYNNGNGSFGGSTNLTFNSNLLSVIGSISATGNINSTSNINANANITANASITANANITGGNLTTSGLISATGNILGSAKILIGTGASTLTNPVAVFQGSGATYTQVSTFNSTGTGSADVVAYGNNGDDTNSWADMGFTGNAFSDAAYTVTGAGDGYFFTQGNAGFGGNMVIATGNVGTTKDIIFATGGFLTGNIKARLYNSTGQFSVVGNLTGGNITTAGVMSSTGNAIHGNITTAGIVSASGNIVGASKILIGTGTSTLTNPVGVFQGSGATYTQMALFNSTGTGSADLVTYGNNGDDTNSWADIGFTGNTFNDAAYTITAAGDGYFFTQGNASFGGNMVIATGNVGTTKDIIFATGGFQTGNIKARLYNSTGQFSVVGNVTGGNITTAGIMSSTGNAIHGNMSVSTGTVTLGNIVNANGNGVGNIGGSTTYFNTVFAQATSAQYADLAENYESDEYYEPGTVLMFGGNMEITLAQEDTTAIAGVVSTKPAHLMNASCPGISLPIALQGRVPCKVTGSIRKGDLMIAAANGYAKSTKTPVIGQVIGKALENFEGMQGIIEIAVGRL
jgi:hypothetical protein